MRFHRHFKYRYGRAANDQGGMVLFFALIALVAMSLAGLVLVRSVDTSTIIAGNLAFKQAATTSGDAGAEAAIAALAAIQAANNAKNVYMDTTHAFNVTSATAGSRRYNPSFASATFGSRGKASSCATRSTSRWSFQSSLPSRFPAAST